MVVLSLTALGAERKVKMQDLPPAVQSAVKEQTKNSTLVGLTREVEDGKTLYEAETKVNGHGRDIAFDSTGAVVSVEEEVPLASIPPAAREAIDKQAAGGKVTKVETITKGREVYYEAVITKKGKSAEFSVDAAGKPVK